MTSDALQNRIQELEAEVKELRQSSQELTKANQEFQDLLEERTIELAKVIFDLRNENREREIAERERKLLAERLASQAKTLETILSATPDHFYLLDLSGTFTFVSEAVLRDLRMSHQDLIGKNWLAAGFPRESAEPLGKAMTEVAATGGSREGEILLQLHDGAHFFEYLLVPVLAAAGGKVESVLATLRDITVRKNLDAQLAFAQKLESIGRLAAGIAHEINTPSQYLGDNLRFLKDGFADLARATDPEAAKNGGEVDLEYLRQEIPSALDQSLEGINRITKIVQAMKEFSHPGGREKVAADLVRAIQNTIVISRHEWKYDSELETDLPEGLPEVPCIVDEINQVVLNMIVNAVHAIQDAIRKGVIERGKICIAARVEDSQFCLSISDNGAGIAPDHVSRIFEPFFTTKEVGRGTGQGLAIAHDVIVNKHKGKISVDSTLGKGTTFTIRIPMAQTAAAGQAMEG